MSITITMTGDTGIEIRELMEGLLGHGVSLAAPTIHQHGSSDLPTPAANTGSAPADEDDEQHDEPDPEPANETEEEQHARLLARAKELNCVRVGPKSRIETLREKIAAAEAELEETAPVGDDLPSVVSVEERQSQPEPEGSGTGAEPEPDGYAMSDVQEAMMAAMQADPKNGVKAVRDATVRAMPDKDASPNMMLIPEEKYGQVIAELRAFVAGVNSEAEGLSV